jgi:hypothetical protein
MQNDAFAIFYHWFDSLRGARTVARDLQTAMAFRETECAFSLASLLSSAHYPAQRRQEPPPHL